MANGEIIQEIKNLLNGEGKLSQSTAMRLSLTIQLQMYERMGRMDASITDIMTKQADQERRLSNVPTKEELADVQRHSIITWIEKHPKVALAIVAGYVVIAPKIDLFVLTQDLLKALGMLH